LFFLSIPVQGHRAFCFTRQQANGEGPVSNIQEPPKEAHHLKVQKRRKRDAEEELFKNRCVMPGDV